MVTESDVKDLLSRFVIGKSVSSWHQSVVEGSMLRALVQTLSHLGLKHLKKGIFVDFRGEERGMEEGREKEKERDRETDTEREKHQ